MAQDATTDYPLTLKKIHTQRVCAEILGICDDLKVSKDISDTAQMIALFHDLGRFEQYVRYHTFKDAISINHAIQSIRDLAKHRVLKELSLRHRVLICHAIRYHNVASIPETLDNDKLFFTRLIRDADKLDIWQIFIDYYHNRDTVKNEVIELGVQDVPECSPSVLNAVKNGRIGLTSDIKTLNDIKLVQMGWLYDLNFKFSFKRVKANAFIERLLAILPQTSEIEQLGNHLMAYRDKKIES